MTLSFETDEIYQWDADDRAPVKPAKAVTYDPTKSAIVQALADASVRAAYQVIGFDDEFPITTTSSSIKIAAFNGTLDDGRVIAFPAAEITGLAAVSNYIVPYALSDVTQSFTGPDGQPMTSAEGESFAGVTAAGSYYAAPAPALEELTNSGWAVVRKARAAAEDGSYPVGPTPPEGDGGTGWGGGGRYKQYPQSVDGQVSLN